LARALVLIRTRLDQLGLREGVDWWSDNPGLYIKGELHDTLVIHPGQTREEVFLVEEEHSALTVGSGSARVLATPWMIAFAERAAYRLLAERLPDGSSSVGVLVDISHKAPTPVGNSVRVSADVSEVNGLWVTLKVRIRDDFELVGVASTSVPIDDMCRKPGGAAPSRR
jgi:predicted thioesterase